MTELQPTKPMIPTTQQTTEPLAPAHGDAAVQDVDVAVPGISRPVGYVKLGSPLPFRVPTRPEEITQDLLADIFRFKGFLKREGRVTSLTMKAIGEGMGAFGDLVLVNVTLEGAVSHAPTSFVAKFAPECHGTMKRMETRIIFLNEAHFYNDFTVQDGGCARPECYLVACEPRRKAPTFCFLIENMMPATTWSRTQGCDSLPHLKMVMKMLATFHARWWAHPKAPPLEWVMHPSDYGGIFHNIFVSTHKKGLPALKRVFGDECAARRPFGPKAGAPRPPPPCSRCARRPRPLSAPTLALDTLDTLDTLLAPRPPSPRAHPRPAPLPAGYAPSRYAPVLEWLPQLKSRYRFLYERLVTGPTLTLAHGDCHLDNLFFSDRYPHGWCARARTRRALVPSTNRRCRPSLPRTRPHATLAHSPRPPTRPTPPPSRPTHPPAPTPTSRTPRPRSPHRPRPPRRPFTAR